VTIGFPVGALVQVRDGQDVGPGEVLALTPQARDTLRLLERAAAGR
jgi:hypothetical protein